MLVKEVRGSGSADLRRNVEGKGKPPDAGSAQRGDQWQKNLDSRVFQVTWCSTGGALQAGGSGDPPRAQDLADEEVDRVLGQEAVAGGVEVGVVFENIFVKRRPVESLKSGMQVERGDAFFFQEGTADVYTQARYGEFRVGEDGELLLVGVRDKDLRALISPGSPACGQAAC